MNQPQRHDPRTRRPTPPEEQFAKFYYDKLATRRDLNAAQKNLLTLLLDQQQRYGFAFGSWQYYATLLGRNKKNIKRLFVMLDARYPGLFLLRRFERMPKRPIMYDPKTANAKATPNRPVQAVYVDEWRARAIQFVILDHLPRLITSATWTNSELVLQLHVSGATIGTTQERRIGQHDLFAGRIRFGAPG